MDTQKSANELLVYKLSGDQMYKDTVHVHSEERGGMKNGDIVRVTVTKDDGSRHSGFFAIRGRPGKGRIGIDFLGCSRLKIKAGGTYKFAFEGTRCWTKIGWAREAADPSARIAMWIAYWSALLGLAGFVLGVIGAVPALLEFGDWFYTKSATWEHPAKAVTKTNEEIATSSKEKEKTPASK